MQHSVAFHPNTAWFPDSFPVFFADFLAVFFLVVFAAGFLTVTFLADFFEAFLAGLFFVAFFFVVFRVGILFTHLYEVGQTVLGRVRYRRNSCF